MSINDSVQFWEFLTKSGKVYCRLLPTSWLTLSPQGGEVQTIPIRTREDGSAMLTALQMSPGVLPSTPVLLTCRGLLLIHAPYNAASTTNSFFAGIKSVCGTNIINAISWSIPWSIGRGKTGMFQLLNFFKTPVARASNCFQIACKIALCVTRCHCV